VVAAVGDRAITASDVEAEYRMERLLDGKNPLGSGPDGNTLNQVRDRLIDRALLEKEATTDGIEVAPDDPAVDERLKTVLQKFPTPDALRSALSEIGLTEDALRHHLAGEERVLRVIDERLRPLATVDASEIETYYRQTFVPELARRSQQPPPSLAAVENRIREILTQQKIDKLLADWLKTLRASRDVHVYGNAAAEDRP
jgi:SurA-like N-terminal domain